MAFEDVCNTVLSLGSASNNLQTHNHQQNMIKSVSMKVEHSIPSLALGLSIHGESTVLNREAFNSVNLVSSYSNSSVKRERSKDVSEEEVEIERVLSFKELSDDQVDEEGMSARKKLRLTKQQSLILEDRFKEHSTLNPKQKQALAKQLNLRPRQVEVWFQNRRARTKLKQTEVECELLKKHWETLTVENKRLQKELQELKVTTTPFYMQYSPAATHTLCPSCQTIDGSGQKYNSNPKSGFSFGANKPHFYNPFTNPSATC